MKKILILVEGQTEERFVKDVLAPYLRSKDIFCIPTIATTRRVKSGPDFKGGVVSYKKVKADIQRLLRDSSAGIVTTLIDYYGFASLVPFRNSIEGNSCFERVRSLEELFGKDINNARFLPYFQLHEFEAMLFVSPQEIANTFPGTKKNKEISKIKNHFKSPEEIDDNPETAPSKRLLKLFPEYQKTSDGPLIIKRIGLERIRNECDHFGRWVTQLEDLT
jgi:hypothetical protein